MAKRMFGPVDTQELQGDYERARQCKRDIWHQLRYDEGMSAARVFGHPLYVEAADNAARAKARLARRRG